MSENRRKFHLTTTAVHAGRHDLARLGTHAPPIDLSTTYPIRDFAEAVTSLEALSAGEACAPNPIYARMHNPTVARFEQAVAELENAEAAVAFSSGMAAISACLLAFRTDGSHVVATRPLYGTTDHILQDGLLGTQVTWAPPTDIAGALRDDTSLVIIETPANPTLDLVDIADVVLQAGDVPVLVDSTFATPILQNPLRHGAAISLHSATKFLGGHGDVIAGVAATSDDIARRLRRTRVATGALLHPLAAFLLHRGMPTLPLRVLHAQKTAWEIARRLKAHTGVRRVFYPGLRECDPTGIVERQMSGPGAILSFEIDADLSRIGCFMEALNLITPAVSLGSTDTLVQHPAGLTHHIVDEAARVSSGVTDGLVRLSVGLEHVDDLWMDLDQAIRRAVPLSDRSSRRRKSQQRLEAAGC